MNQNDILKGVVDRLAGVSVAGGVYTSRVTGGATMPYVELLPQPWEEVTIYSDRRFTGVLPIDVEAYHTDAQALGTLSQQIDALLDSQPKGAFDIPNHALAACWSPSPWDIQPDGTTRDGRDIYKATTTYRVMVNPTS